MTIYEEIEAERKRLATAWATTTIMRGSSFSDWVVYILNHLTKAGGACNNEWFRCYMITTAAMIVLSIEAIELRLKEHD